MKNSDNPSKNRRETKKVLPRHRKGRKGFRKRGKGSKLGLSIKEQEGGEMEREVVGDVKIMLNFLHFFLPSTVYNFNVNTLNPGKSAPVPADSVAKISFT